MAGAHGARAVALRAVELAAAGGIDLPEDLALWALAGGRPVAAARPGEPEELGELLEESLTPSERRKAGAHFTPRALSADLAARALAGRDRPTVGDPSCGGGALLLAVARLMERCGNGRGEVVRRLHGMDLDPVAAATTEAALTLWAGEPVPAGNIAVADALLERPAWPALDVVIGNPPFLSQLDSGTTRGGSASAAVRARFGEAVRAYTDTAGLFLLVAADLAAPGGIVALLQPQSVLAARDAAGVRDAIAARGRLVDVWFPPGPGFAAAVEVCVPIIEVGHPSATASWSDHLARANGVPAVVLPTTAVLGDVAITTAAFRSEYYGMVDHVHEQADCRAGVPLVTTGLVDLGRAAWGERPARIGRRTWARPVLDVAALDGRAADWARRTGGPKLVVATQTRVVEVVVDEVGDMIPGVPLVVVLADPERLWPLAAALASPTVTAWALQQVAGTARAPQALKVTAALLRQVPLPSDDDAWCSGTDAFRAGDLDGYVAAMAVAYGTGPAVGEWWMARARTVWSPERAHR